MLKKTILSTKRPVRSVFSNVFRLGTAVFLGVFYFWTPTTNFPAFFSFPNSLVRVAGESENRLFAQETPNKLNRRTDQIVFFSIPVAVDAAPIYAGPDENAYQTGVVAKNRFVEVYFRTQDGWCAVRPPLGSFSWVNAKFVRLDGESEGRVASTDGKIVPARVGAATVERSSIVQVGLKSNQKLKIVGKATGPNGSEWLKISPPPGEFRWIREASLLTDPAAAKLPTKLTFQAEFLADLDRRDETELDSNGVDDGSFAIDEKRDAIKSNPIVGASDNPTPMNDAEFHRETAALGTDVLQTLQNPTATDAEFELLARRAEYLFDAAPNDSERFGVQKIYDAIKIAERRKNEAVPTTPRTFPVDAPPLDATAPDHFLPNAVPFAPNEPLYLPDLSINPMISTKSKFSRNASRRANDGAASPSKNRLEFAFSNENAPFRLSPKKKAVVASGAATPSFGSTTSKGGSATSLPPLFPDGKRLIVPPANYRANSLGQATRQNAKLVAAKEEKENVASSVVARDDAVGASQNANAQTERISTDKTILTTKNDGWQIANAHSSSSSTATPTSNAVVPASAIQSKRDAAPRPTPPSTPTKKAAQSPQSAKFGPSKIRQTGDFQPIAVSKSTVFDAEGTLAALSNASRGTPKFALVRPNDDRFDVVCYLEAGDGVSLEKYLGQEVGVQGLEGTVVVDGTARKLTIVRSVFPQRRPFYITDR